MDMQTLLGSLQASDPMMASPLGPSGADPMVPTTGPHGLPITGFPGPQSAAQGPNQVAPTPGNMMAPQMPMQGSGGAPSATAGPSGAMGQQPTLYERIMSRLFHTPTGLQQYLSPEDVQHARSQALLQMGARMMGAGLPPGSSSHFGMNLANTLAGAEPAYQGGLQQALQAQQTGMGLAQAQNQMKARQALGALTPPGPDSSLRDQVAYYNQALQYALQGSLPEATALAWGLRAAQAALAKENAPEKPSRDFDTIQWGQSGYTIRKDKNTGQVESPIDIPEKGIKAGDWVSPGTLGQAPPSREQVAQMSRQEQNDAFREASSRFDKWNADKTVAKMDDTNRLYGRLDGLLAGAAAGNGQVTSDVPIMLAKIMHEGGVGRIGLIQQLSHIDPSLPGRIEAWADKQTSGQLPPKQIQQVRDVVAGLRGLDAIEYDNKRSKYLAAWGDKVGGLDSMIPTTRTQYGIEVRDATPDEQKLADKDPGYKWHLLGQGVRVK